MGVEDVTLELFVGLKIFMDVTFVYSLKKLIFCSSSVNNKAFNIIMSIRAAK